jgi:transposase InsO family protein
VATLAVGTRLRHDGESWRVVGLDGGRVTLLGARGQRVQMHTATLLAAASTRLIGVPDRSADPLGVMLAGLSDDQLGMVRDRFAHVMEVLTGYRSGSPQLAQSGEPRPAFRPSLTLTQRCRAKAAELNLTTRTIERWISAVRESGPAGLVPRSARRVRDRLAGIDPRWIEMCQIVLDEHTDASRPTRQLLLQRVETRLVESSGEGVVPTPGRTRAYAALSELSRGSNAFTGSTKGKRSIANRPPGVYGRLRPTRPREYHLLDTTTLDVYAMESLTLRWVQCELTIAMDLYSRAIVGLRLSARSTKAVDAAVVVFEAVTPGSTRCTGVGLLPYAGLPSAVVVDAEKLAGRAHGHGLPAVAPETIVVDHGRIYLSEHLLSVCARLGISIQPARPLTLTDKAAVERFFGTLGSQRWLPCPVTRARTCIRAGRRRRTTPTSSSTSSSGSSASG